MSADIQPTSVAAMQPQPAPPRSLITVEEGDAILAAETLREQAIEEAHNGSDGSDSADDETVIRNIAGQKTIKVRRHGVLSTGYAQIKGIDRERGARRFGQRLRHAYGDSAVRSASILRQEQSTVPINERLLLEKKETLETNIKLLTDKLGDIYARKPADRQKHEAKKRAITGAWRKFNTTLDELRHIDHILLGIEKRRIEEQNNVLPDYINGYDADTSQRIRRRRGDKIAVRAFKLEAGQADGKIRSALKNDVRKAWHSQETGEARPQRMQDKLARRASRRSNLSLNGFSALAEPPAKPDNRYLDLEVGDFEFPFKPSALLLKSRNMPSARQDHLLPERLVLQLYGREDLQEASNLSADAMASYVAWRAERPHFKPGTKPTSATPRP